jgi:cyclase
MKRVFILTILCVTGGLSMAAAGYQQQAQPAGPKTIEMQKLKDNFYVLASSAPGGTSFSGGNVSVFVTDAGVTIVDTKLAGWGQPLLDDIKKITDKPVTRIINTHTHGDHTGNNDQFGANVEIVAQENTKTNMEKMDAFKGDKAKFLPSKTYKDTMTLGSGNSRIDLYYFGAGHTSGDTWVVFPSLRIVATGDMFAWKDAPLCDRNNGGSCVQFPQTLAKAIAGIKNVDTVVPGHSPVTTPKDLQEYQRFNAEWVKAAEDARKSGKTVDEAAASIHVADKYPGYKSERLKAAVQAVYDEAKP